MPKLPPKKKSLAPPPKPIHERLADAADREGLRASQMIRFPKLLKTYEIDPAQATPGTAQMADDLNRERINETLSRYGCNPF